MTKRMLIDDTSQEETRVVVLDGNKLEDVEFESSNRKQIKGNVYLAKVMRIEPSLQAAFVDYGGNRHGFLAFGEIHPDYYNVSPEKMQEIDKEVNEIIENKKQQLREREERREQMRLQREAEAKARAEAEEKAKAEAEEKAKAEAEAEETKAEQPEEKPSEEIAAETAENNQEEKSSPKKKSSRGRRKKSAEKTEEISAETENAKQSENVVAVVENVVEPKAENTEEISEPEVAEENSEPQQKPQKRRGRRKKTADVAKSENEDKTTEQKKELKVLAEKSSVQDEGVYEDVAPANGGDEDDQVDDEDDEQEYDFEMQRKLLKLRKLYYNSTIQDVIKEGQILLVQVVKEERGNKGAALTTYLSLAGRYCVLMPNRIKSGGVSRKITNAADRKRLKDIMKSLPLSSDMSMIIRTAGEEKTKQEITRDYNYLIRTWNQIRINSLKSKAPMLIHEEGNLIKRALRDMCTKDVSEVLIDGERAYQMAKEFVKIFAPNQLKKIKGGRKGDIPLFQRFQVENQLDKLHNPVVQLESGGYLVINPTEALVSIDVNSGRATKEKDIEETALNTNLEAADEIARQLRMRNLAGLVVVDFIDMEEQQNNHAVEKRMKEAMKNDRARVQIAKMSCFGLLEISRQRMHSSFFESNYVVCPHCHGIGMMRTEESAGLFILREIEEEGIKNRFAKLNVSVPVDIAAYLLNQKRKNLCELESKYGMEIVICADDSIKNVADYKFERIKNTKPTPETHQVEETPIEDELIEEDSFDTDTNSEEKENNGRRGRRRNRRNRFDRGHRGRDQRGENISRQPDNGKQPSGQRETPEPQTEEKPKRKTGWWRKLIGGE